MREHWGVVEYMHLNADHHEFLPWDGKKSVAHISGLLLFDMNSNRISCKFSRYFIALPLDSRLHTPNRA
jgi:hypothetical protein